MKTFTTRCVRRTEQGGVAVEAAFVLPIIILFLAIPLFLARIFWYYSVAEKAAHDGARFLSQATRAEILEVAGGAPVGVAALAEAVVDAELEEIRPGLVVAGVTVLCDNFKCSGAGVPSIVYVAVEIRMRDEIFGPLTAPLFGEDGLRLTAGVTMRYAGN